MFEPTELPFKDVPSTLYTRHHNVWYVQDGMTPLMLAAEAGQVDSVKLLVEKGAEVTLPHEVTIRTSNKVYYMEHSWFR